MARKCAYQKGGVAHGFRSLPSRLVVPGRTKFVRAGGWFRVSSSNRVTYNTAHITPGVDYDSGCGMGWTGRNRTLLERCLHRQKATLGTESRLNLH